jgi:CRP/FNR family transcriptional regulator
MDRPQLLRPKNTETEFPTRLLHLPYGTNLFDHLGAVKKIPKNTILAEPGNLPKCCYVVKKGCVVSFEYTLSGEERIYGIHMPPCPILEAPLLFNKPCAVYFKTVEPSEMICVDRHTLLDLMREDFHTTMAVIESISNKFIVGMEQIREATNHDVAWRLCNLLLEFAAAYGVLYDGATLIQKKLSQQFLSNLLGVNRVTVNRISQKLKDLGFIEQINGYYCIGDIEKLKRHMEYLDP